MNKLLFIIILFQYSYYLCYAGILGAGQQHEQDLINTLKTGYNKNIRPTSQVNIIITAMLQQIISIDEKQQIMTSSLFIAQTWIDNRLSWSDNSSYNLSVIMLPVKDIWIPDTMIINSADSNGYLTYSNDYSLASIDSSGQIYMILPALAIKTRCNFNVQKFPFDKQICSINLTSWSQGVNRIIYEEDPEFVIDISEYSEHALWKLERTDMLIIESGDRVPFEDTYNTILAIQLYIQRKPLFFLMNGMFACWILNCVTLLSFALPFAVQITLSMTCFLTYSVYSLNFSNIFPQQSEYLMMITLYFLLSIFWTLLAMIWFIIYAYYTTKSEIPQALSVCTEQLQKIFSCYLFRFNAKKKKENENVIVPNNQPACVERMTLTKCHFCDRCQLCQTTFEQNQIKDKRKKTIESKWNILHYFVFFCIFLLILISDLIVWIVMSK